MMSPLREDTEEVPIDGIPKYNDVRMDSGDKGHDLVGIYHPTGGQATVAIETRLSLSRLAPKSVWERFNIEGRVFLVTGGSQGLGLAMAI